MRFPPAILAPTLCAAAVCAAPAAAGVTVTLKPRCAPVSSVVRLGDVALLTADSPADARDLPRLRAVPLTPAPAGGRTAHLTARQVRARAEAGGFAVTIAGAETVTLTAPRPRTVREAANDRPAGPGDRAFAVKFVTAAARRALDRGFPAGSVPADYRLETDLSPDAARTLARDRPDGCELTGLSPAVGPDQAVTVRYLDRLDRVVTLAATVTLVPPRLVPVLTEPVPRGAPVRAEQVRWRVAPGDARPSSFPPATFPPPARPAAATVAAGRPAAVPLPRGEAKRDLPAGTVLNADDVRAAPLVRANQVVTVESRVGGISVTRSLKATRGGTLGQTVPLTDPDTRERLFARVIGNRRLRIVGDAATSPPHAERPRAGGNR